MHLFNLLPRELIATISDYLETDTKRVLSLVDHRIRRVVLSTIRCIEIFPRSSSPSDFHSSNIPNDILVKVINRYPKLQRIIFGRSKNGSGIAVFRKREILYLKSLISYLESNPEKHPFSFIKKIEFEDTYNDLIPTNFSATAKELNARLLGSLGHRGLENIKIKFYHPGSHLSGTEIQPVLRNSPDLKTFVFDGFLSQETVSLNFENLLQLSKVKLLNWRGSTSTITSLRNCPNLEELVLSFASFASDEINAIFKDHPWKLKRLELRDFHSQTADELDAITKKLPHLECLSIGLHRVSDNGMELIGRNCPRLKILKFSNKNITDSGLHKLTKHLPHLEIISFDVAYNITENGVAALAQNCKHLQFIEIIHHKRIAKWGFDALIEHCKDLKIVVFTHGGPISLEGLQHMLEQIPKLRYVEIRFLEGIPEEQIEAFRKKFPQLKNIPFKSSAKKLRKLIV